ncbi:hypothetical protein AL073_00490 [Loktanella sp. 1ANDIMAR09]|nr:hypothetical protein AL073_00490 [Loktanella sp. 1ANDIMAR09]
MPKRILTVGFQLATENAETANYHDKTSLLDWDIVLFRPDASSYLYNEYDPSEYLGKVALNDRNSFGLKEACAHWRRELQEAVSNGKTVIVHLSKPTEVYVATGTKEHSGTGRNRRTTRHVELFSNFKALPLVEDWTATHGTAMTLRPEYREQLSSYWSRFADRSFYEVIFAERTKGASITTKHGNRAVGLTFSSKSSDGSLIFLPDLDFDPDEFFEERDNDMYFSDAARQFAGSYLSEVLSIDRAFRQSSAKTSEPQWAKEQTFSLTTEKGLREKLLRAEEAVEIAQQKKEAIQGQLVEAGQLRDLLFETGKPLEAAILKALKLMGFDAKQYEDGTSEFDAVFSSPEGRLLGEAEGRDSKPIAIGKLRQLTMNIHEDLERDEVQAPAKGILFGNGFRLIAPHEREPAFTDKCVSSAVSMSIGLVTTYDLFEVARYLSESGDKRYAKRCRTTLTEESGIVRFPSVPVRAEDAVSEHPQRMSAKRAAGAETE